MRPMRPGGEYREEGERDRSKWELRAFFLGKIAALAQEVLEDLRDDVLPAFREAYEATKPPPERSEPATPWGEEEVVRQGRPDWVRWRFQAGDWETDTTDWPDKLVAFRDRLLAWADNYHLSEHWVLDAALRTLIFWFHRDASTTSVDERLEQWKTIYSPASVEHVFKEQGRDIQEALDVVRTWKAMSESSELRFLPPRFHDAFRTPRFTFEYEGWMLQVQPWRQYERELRAAFDEKLESYEDLRKGSAKERGLEAPREVRSLEHFEWLVLWQVREMSYREIALEYDLRTSETSTGVTSSTVGEAVRDKAARIGLTRRTQ